MNDCEYIYLKKEGNTKINLSSFCNTGNSVALVRVTQSSQKWLEKYKICQRELTFGLSIVLSQDLFILLLFCRLLYLFLSRLNGHSWTNDLGYNHSSLKYVGVLKSLTIVTHMPTKWKQKSAFIAF